MSRIVSNRYNKRFAYRNKLPFMCRDKRGTKHPWWNVEPTGDYFADYEIGRRYAMTFWHACGHRSSFGNDLGEIIFAMLEVARPAKVQRPTGWRKRHSGIETGFIRTIGKLIDVVIFTPALIKNGKKRQKQRKFDPKITRKALIMSRNVASMMVTEDHKRGERLAAEHAKQHSQTMH